MTPISPRITPVLGDINSCEFPRLLHLLHEVGLF